MYINGPDLIPYADQQTNGPLLRSMSSIWSTLVLFFIFMRNNPTLNFRLNY